MGKCERCNGFLVRDSIYNVGGQFLEIEIARCVNCGHIVDLTRLKSYQGKIGTIGTTKEEVMA